MLDDAGFQVEEHLLTTRDEADSFQKEHGVTTTPQTFIVGRRIGGSEELAEYLEQTAAHG